MSGAFPAVRSDEMDNKSNIESNYGLTPKEVKRIVKSSSINMDPDGGFMEDVFVMGPDRKNLNSEESVVVDVWKQENNNGKRSYILVSNSEIGVEIYFD